MCFISTFDFFFFCHCHISLSLSPALFSLSPSLSFQMGPAAQAVYSLPYSGGNDINPDRISKLAYFNFLLSCFRRDSHKIDSFLKVLRCRLAKTQPERC